MITRRSFVKKTSLAAGALMLPMLNACDSQAKLTGSILGPDFSRGHRVRNFKDIKAAQVFKEDVVIIGGGVSGLSAGRWLNKNNQSFVLLELEDECGGNSRAGQNSITAYPWGAHYLPIPSIHHKELISFLEECNVITGYQGNLPVYNEYHLCFDPKERLFINHHWQEGLIPNDGLPLKDREEIQLFLKLMDDYRHLKGSDGKLGFDIPLDQSSQDKNLLTLDMISMAQFMREHNFTSPYLFWYVNYCSADDYGASIDDISAWAGIHYFASRKGEAANAKIDDVLTWPEGNFWLVKQLRKDIENKIRTKSVTLSVAIKDKLVQVDYWDVAQNQLNRIEAKQLIMATPQFVNKHLLHASRELNYHSFHYAPWMVANLTIDSTLDEKHGEPLSWDNVIYGSNSLGYVHATHQNTSIPKKDTVITYYRPLVGRDCAAMRKKAQQMDWKTWSDSVFDDLRQAHSSLRSQTQQLDVWIWGHGMIRPGVNFIWSNDRMMARKAIDNKIFFAHSDLSGVSIFEEAFNSGIDAGKAILKNG